MNEHVENCPYPTRPEYGCWCPMPLACTHCGRDLDETSLFGGTGQHDCSAEALRESQGSVAVSGL